MKTYKDALLVSLGDMQIGSTMALAPRTWNLIDGGTYTASPVQNLIRKYYETGILAIKELRKKKRLIFILNGEPTDGVHHGTPQLISQVAGESNEMASSIIDETLRELNFDKSKGDRLYFVEGTEAHDGKQHQNHERVARDFEDIATFYRRDQYGKDGRILHPYLKAIINGKKYRIQHHGGGVGSRAWTRENSLQYYIKNLFMSYVQMGEEPPDWFLQAHYHRYIKATYHGVYNGERKTIHGRITPALQVATAFVKRIAPAELSDIGIYYQEIDAAGNVQEHEESIYRAPEDDYERI